MAKIDFHSIENTEKEAIFKDAATKVGMTAFAVEKDWWVVQTLSIVFELAI